MSSTEPTTRRQERARATADQLLVAAKQVFEEKGYRATTVGAITERAATAHGTFYLYFKNKEDAFGRVFSRAVEELRLESESPWQGDDAKGALRHAVNGYFRVVDRHRGLWRCLMEGTYQSPAIERMWLDMRRPFIDRLEVLLEAQSRRGLARAADARATAVALGSMVEWTAFTVIELDEPTGVGLDRAVDAVADLWFDGVYAAQLGA